MDRNEHIAMYLSISKESNDNDYKKSSKD